MLRPRLELNDCPIDSVYVETKTSSRNVEVEAKSLNDNKENTKFD